MKYLVPSSLTIRVPKHRLPDLHAVLTIAVNSSSLSPIARDKLRPGGSPTRCPPTSKYIVVVGDAMCRNVKEFVIALRNCFYQSIARTHLYVCRLDAHQIKHVPQATALAPWI